MRGGEVLGGYGYAEREEYMRPRGELGATPSEGTSENLLGEGHDGSRR